MSEWKKVKLGELCEITSSKRCHASERSTEGIPFYCSKEIILLDKGETILHSDYIPVSLYEDIKERFGVPNAGDLLLTTRGTNGIPYIYKDTDCFYFADGNLSWFKNFTDKADVQFIYYWFKSYKGKHVIDSIAKGTAQKAVPIEGLRNIELFVPSIASQHRIATILSRYDTLIENYQKQIKLLEEAAQRLYKEWLVDLRFPGYENVKMVDGLPEGWERKRLGEVVAKSIGGGWGKETPQEKYDREGYVIRGTDISKLKNGSLNEIPFRYHTESNLKERTLSDGDIIFEVSGGSEKEPVGRMYLITQPILDYYCKDVICASFCKKVSFANNMISVLCYFAMQHCRNTGDMKKFEKDSAGNIINFAWTTFLEDFNVLFPNKEVLNAFYKRANAIINNEVQLSLQIRLLTEARDRLLPRLMGGEMEV